MGDDARYCMLCRHCGEEASMLSQPRVDRYDKRMGDSDTEEESVVERKGYVARVSTYYLHTSVAYCNRCNRLLSESELLRAVRE